MDPGHTHTRSSRIPRPSSRGRSPSPPKEGRHFTLSPTPEHLSSASSTSIQQLKNEITQLKKKLEEENSLIKSLKHEKAKELQKIRTEEQGRSKNALEDQRYKLNQEKDRALENLRAQLAKQHASEMSKILKERESFMKANRNADKERLSFSQSLQEEMRAEAREEAKVIFAAEKNRFIQEIEELNRKKRELEEQLKNESLAGRHKLDDYKRLNEEHQREIDQLRKDARKDIILLLDELKAKDRIILELEKELGHQAGYTSGLAVENGSSKKALNLTKMRDAWEKLTTTTQTTSKKDKMTRSLGTESLSQSTSSLDDSKKSTHVSDENQRTETSDRVLKVPSSGGPSRNTDVSARESLIPVRGTPSRGSPMPLRGSPLPKESSKMRRSLPVLSPPARSSTPTIQVTDSLQRKLREAEEARRRLERKCKMLSDELKSMKKEFPKRKRPQSPWTTEKMDLLTKPKMSKKPAQVRRRADEEETREREEEINRLRKQMDDQFEEIVQLKQAAAAERKQHLFGRRNSLPSETQSEFNASLNSSLVVSEADDLFSLGRSLSRPDLDSRESLTTPSWNENKLEAADEAIQELKEKLQEMETSREMLLSELHDSKEQNELLEFQLLEAAESGKGTSGREMPLTDEILREILKYMQTHEGKEIDLSELKQQIDQLTQEKIGKFSDADQKSLEILTEILEHVEAEVANLREIESDLQEEVKEKSDEVHTLAEELTQLLKQLNEKEETILVTNKKLDELLESEFDLSEKIKDYETQIVLLQEELLERRDKDAGESKPSDSDPSQPVVEKADSEEGEKTPRKGQADKEVQVRFRRRRPAQNRDMSREIDLDDLDEEEGEDVTFSDDDLIDLLPGDSDGEESGVRDGHAGREGGKEVKFENDEVEKDRSSQGQGKGLGSVASGDSHMEEINRMQGRLQSLEEENNGLLAKQSALQSEISNLKETISSLENKVFESEENEETMSKVISDQLVQIQNLRKDSENLISKDVVEMRERELQEVIKDLQAEEEEMRLKMEKMNEEKNMKMEMFESERKMIEDRLQEAEGEKKLLRDALEKEKQAKEDDVSGEGGVRFYKNEVERLNYVVDELSEKQLQAEELVASLEAALQNVRQQSERQEAEKQELEGRCCQLEEQRQEAYDSLKMKQEEVQYLLREKGEMEVVRDELEKEVAELKERILQKDGDIPEGDEKCDDETEIKKEEISTLMKRVVALEYDNEELINFRDEAENLKEQVKLLKKEKEATEESLQAVSNLREKLSQELEGKEKANEEILKGRKETEDKLMELMKAVEEMERKVGEKDAEIEEMEKLKEKEMGILQKEIEVLQKTNEELCTEKEQTKDLVEEKEKIFSEKNSLEERVNQLQSSKCELDQEMEEKELESLKLEKERNRMSEEIKHLNSLLEDHTRERDRNVFEELQENIHLLEIEKGSLECDLLKEKSENEKLRKDCERMEVMKRQMEDREVELKGVINDLEAFKGREDNYERKLKDQEFEIDALQRKVEDLSNKVQTLGNKNRKLEENESKLFSDSFEKDAKIQAMHAKELELEEKVRKLLMEKVGSEKQLEERDGLMDELEARKIKIGNLEDELEKLRVEGELSFNNDGSSSDGDDSRGLREDFDWDGGERGEQRGGELSDDVDNLYSVVEQEIWEEVQVSVVRPTSMVPPLMGGKDKDHEGGVAGHNNNNLAISGLEEQEDENTILNRRIEMLEAEVRSQKDLLEEETLAKEKLQKDIWEMLQTQSDLRQQLTTLQDQNEGLQANMNFLRELEEETKSLTVRVEKMTEEKRVLEAKMREVEASKAEKEEKLEEKGRELDIMKEEVDAIEEERKRLMEKLNEMEDKMKARVCSLEGTGRSENVDSEKLDLNRELEESLKDEIRKLEERNTLLEEQLHDKTKISLDTSEMDSLLFSSDDEAEFDGRGHEDVEDKVKRLEKLNHALKDQVKHLLAFQHLGVEDHEAVKEDVDEAEEKEADETEEDKEHSSRRGKLEEGVVDNKEDLKKQLGLSEENNKYLEQQLEDLRQLMQDGGFENQDVLIEKVEALEKSQKQLMAEIESLKRELAEKEEELLSTQQEMQNTERKFSVRVEELEKSEQELLEKLEATNEEWKHQSESSMERINELENVRGQLRQQLSIAEEQLEEMQASGGFDNLSNTQQSGPSLLDEGLGALDIGRSSFDYTEDFDEDDGDAMQQEMEVALRELDDEDDEDMSTALREENEKLKGRVEELEKSEVELMEKVEILEQSELAMSDLCDELKADIDQKMSEMSEMRGKLTRLENVEDENSDSSKTKQGILEAEVKHLQEQVSFMEEERETLLQKIEEVEMERDAEEMEELEEKETEKLEDSRKEQDAQAMSAENKVEINIKHWQAKRLEEIQQVEQPVLVRTVAPYNPPLPYWKLGMTGCRESNQVRLKLVDWKQSSGEEEEYLQEFADEEEFIKNVASCVEQRRPNAITMDFEEKILLEGEGLMDDVEEDESGERTDDLGEKELRELKEKSSQERDVVIHKDFEEYVLSLGGKEIEAGSFEEVADEEQSFEFCDEPVICKEEVLTVQITEDIFMPLRSESQEETSGSVNITGKDGMENGEEIHSLKERIKDLEESEVILKERISELERDERLSGALPQNVEEDGVRTGEESKEDLKMKIRELEDNEAVLKIKLEEMEIMQNAFEETLSQADTIVKEREAEYLQKIEALESSQSDLKHLLEISSGGDQGLGNAAEENVADGEGTDRKIGEEDAGEKIKELENLVEVKQSQILLLEIDLKEKIESEEKVKEQNVELRDKMETLESDKEEKSQLIRDMEERLGEERAKAERERTLKERIADLEEMVAKKSEQIMQLEQELADVSKDGRGDASQVGDVEGGNVSGETAEDAKVDQGDSEELGVLQVRIEELENSEMKLITELEESLENEEKLKEDIQRLEELMNKADGDEDELREKVKHLESHVEELNNKLDVLEDENEKYEEENAEITKELEVLRETNMLAKNERDEEREEIEELKSLGKRKDEELLMMAGDLEANSKRVQELEGIAKTLEMGVENLTSKLVEGEDKVRNAEVEMEKMMREKEHAEDEARKLKEVLEVQGRSLSGRDDRSHHHEGGLERGIDKEDGAKQKDQKDESETMEDEISTQGEVEETVSVLQEELHLSNIQIEDLKRSKIALEEQLKKLRSNRHSNGMITLPEDEYKSLKARAHMVDTSEDPEVNVDLNSTNDEEQFANAGKLWVKLDQTTKELRKYQELYNTTIKEVGHLKQALREVSEKHEAYLQGRRGSMLVDTVALPSAENDRTVDNKLIQTRPLKTITSDALKVRLATDTSRGQTITLQEMLDAIPEPMELGDMTMLQGSQSCSEVIAANDSLYLLDSPSPLKTTLSSQEALSESFLNTSMWPPDLAKHEKQKAWQEIQSALTLENMLEEDDTPPLPKSMPPRASSNLSFTETPDLPNLPPPIELSFLSDDDDEFSKDEIDLDQSEVMKITAQTQQEQAVAQPELPALPSKPAASDWLKEMQLNELEKVLNEAEEMRKKLQELEEKVEEKDEELNHLKIDKEELELKAREAQDGYHYKEKLQEKEEELEEKEKHILRLKGDLKKKEAEATPLKLQLELLREKQTKLMQENGQAWQLKDKLERLQDQYKDKEQSMRLLEAEKMRMKEDMEGKDRKLFSKEREVEKCQEEIEMLKEKLKNHEQGRKQKSDEDLESEKEYLKKQNEQLRKQVDQLEPLKERMDNLQSQLEKGLSSQGSNSSLTKKLQQAEKMLEEKMADELRLLEDNECLQKRIDSLEKEKNYHDGLEADYESMKEMFDDLEYKKHEAELSVAPLKAKVSYLLKKFQEKDTILRKMASEVAIKNPERASEIFDEIERLQHQLPVEDIEPRKTAWEEKSFNFDRRKAKSLDILNNNGSEVTEDSDQRGGGVSLQDLIKEASKPAVGNFSLKSDIGRSQDSLLAVLPELNNNHLSGSPHFKERNARRGRKNKVSSSDSDDTLNGLLQSDAEDFSISNTSSNHLPNLISLTGVITPGTSVPPVGGTHRARPPLLRMMKTDLGTGGKPSPVSSMDKIQPVNGIDALTSGIPFRGTGSDGTDGTQLKHPSLLSGVPQSTIGMAQSVPSGPTVPSIGGPGVTGSFAKNTMPLFHQPQSKGMGTLQQNGFPPSRGPLANPVSHNSGNVPSVNVPVWNVAPRVPGSHDLSTSLSSSLPSSHILPSSGNRGISQGTGLASPASGPLQPPRSLSVARMVSKHSVLLVWTLPALDEMARNNGHEVAGYKIYVNGNPQQFVTSPHLAKALVTNLNLKTVRTFGIQTVSVHGKGSSVRQVNFAHPQSDVSQSGMSDASLSDSAREPSTDASSVVGERPKQRMFMAVYSYNPMEHSPNENPERELTFKEGDLIRVLGHMRNDGFYHGMINGKKGLVPSNFIEEISVSSSGKKKTRREVPRKQPHREVSKSRKEKEKSHRPNSQSKV